MSADANACRADALLTADATHAGAGNKMINKKKMIDAVSIIGTLTFLFTFINTSIKCNLMISFVFLLFFVLNQLPDGKEERKE